MKISTEYFNEEIEELRQGDYLRVEFERILAPKLTKLRRWRFYLAIPFGLGVAGIWLFPQSPAWQSLLVFNPFNACAWIFFVFGVGYLMCRLRETYWFYRFKKNRGI